jgi:hypothetical protein
MLPLEVFDWEYQVEYPFREICLSEAEACLIFDGFKFYIDGSLFEGKAGFDFLWKNLLSRHFSFLERSPLSFRVRFIPFWLVPPKV